MVNVNIIEGELAWRQEIYDDIKQHLQNNKYFTSDDMSRKHNTSLPIVTKIRRQVCEDLKITFKPISCRVYFKTSNEGWGKYYSKRKDGKYQVLKVINGKTVYFGQYDTEKIAKKMVEELKLVNWDKNELNNIRDKLGVKHLTIKPRGDAKYYSLHCGEYVVTKSIDKHIVYFGTYGDEETAKRVVEELKKVEWDKSKLHEIKKKLKDEGIIKGKEKYCNKTKFGTYKLLVPAPRKSNSKGYKNIYFGCYKSLEDAVAVRDELEKVGWDKKQLPDIKRKLNIRRKYYSQSNRNGLWYVSRRIKGKEVYFGGYETEEDAKKIVKKLDEIGWDKTKLTEIQEELGLKVHKPKYYYKVYDEKESHFPWVVQKIVNGKHVYFGHYETEDDAQKIVSELKLVDWDKSRLHEIREKVLG